MGKEKKTDRAGYQVRVSSNALHNIDEITGYLSFINHQPQNAIKVGESILATFERIGQSPFAFKGCAELLSSTKVFRQAKCLPWLIIYKVTPVEIIILGIIHSARKPTLIKKLRKIK